MVGTVRYPLQRTAKLVPASGDWPGAAPFQLKCMKGSVRTMAGGSVGAMLCGFRVVGGVGLGVVGADQPRTGGAAADEL